jgi:peptidoglycan/LPS O-acetylase OafA/YrhL
MQRPLTYRPDIDGMRAVAVLAVIGYHAGARWFRGGFVGVDIFFVISGYLITSIIARQLPEGRFRFADFYARRCKRIFPSLILVLVSVMAYGWLVLLPDEYEHLGKHVAAGAGFVSNFALWFESGYFDKAAEAKPLLHLWSLGIEEQFYLLWPPVLIWAWKRKWNLLHVAAGIISLSFVMNIGLVSLWQASDAYYLPPTRFWELLLGAALACAHLFGTEELAHSAGRVKALIPGSLFIFSDNLLAMTGLILVLVSIVALSKETLFPGWWALLPTVGTLLLISAGPGAWANRKLLSNRAVVFIGLISYPLYLWHWPLLSFAQIDENGSASTLVKACAVCFAFLLAWATYTFVEAPIRTGTHRIAWVLVPSVVVAGCFGLAAYKDYLHVRAEKYGVDKIVSAQRDWDFPGHLRPVHTDVGYYFEQGTGRSKVLFVGDSYMEQYYPRIDKLLTENPGRTKGVLFVTQPGCLPIRYMQGFVQLKCKGLAERALSLAQDPSITTVVISAGWMGYSAFRSDESRVAFGSLTAMLADYRRMGKSVYVVLPIPAGGEFAPQNLVKRSVLDFGFRIVDSPVPRGAVEDSMKWMTTRLTDIAHAIGATAIDPFPYICREGTCPTFMEDGLPVYKDGAHFRPEFVRRHITFLDALVCDACTLPETDPVSN